jgi:hypothetical protein
MKSSFLFIAVLTAAFISAPVFSEPKVEEVQKNHKVKFENVNVVAAGEGRVLKGKIKKSIYNSRLPAGHIDYLVLSSGGDVLVEEGFQYNKSLSLRRWKRGSSFSVVLPENIPDDAVIRIGFHKNEHVGRAENPKVSHIENTLIPSK